MDWLTGHSTFSQQRFLFTAQIHSELELVVSQTAIKTKMRDKIHILMSRSHRKVQHKVVVLEAR